ncbi:MAG: hypothetical protein U5L45_26950 [Saprospiraceae bacterium]|nr:hypothetical protein [Saprospiraceae bacterium]
MHKIYGASVFLIKKIFDFFNQNECAFQKTSLGVDFFMFLEKELARNNSLNINIMFTLKLLLFEGGLRWLSVRTISAHAAEAKVLETDSARCCAEKEMAILP